MAFMVVRQLIMMRPGIPLVDAQAALKAGTAVLVDLREPMEWHRGVAKAAALMPFSDLRGDHRFWRAFLGKHRGHRLFLYCRSGFRSSMAAAQLRSEGLTARNARSLAARGRAGIPICRPSDRAP